MNKKIIYSIQVLLLVNKRDELVNTPMPGDAAATKYHYKNMQEIKRGKVSC